MLKQTYYCKSHKIFKSKIGILWVCFFFCETFSCEMFILFFSIAVSSIISIYYIMYLSVCLWSVYISIHLLKYFHLFLDNPFMVYLSNYYYHLWNILHTHILLSCWLLSSIYVPSVYIYVSIICFYIYQ